ncbi:MAG: hypothetical protein RSC87_09245, partial [Muribaculaceae bacterium]
PQLRSRCSLHYGVKFQNWRSEVERLRRSASLAHIPTRNRTSNEKSVGICVICGKMFTGVGGVQRLRRRSRAIRYLPHNCVRDASLHYGVPFQN